MHQCDRPRWGYWSESLQQHCKMGSFDQAHVQLQLSVGFVVIVDGHHMRLL